MKIFLINKKTSCELYLCGDYDSKAAPEAAEIFENTAKRFHDIILDLSRLDFICYAGITAIVKFSSDMDKKRDRLYIRGASSAVREIFELSGLSTSLRFYEKD